MDYRAALGASINEVSYLPAADIHSPTMIAQYETREECETYAFNVLFGQSILFKRTEFAGEDPDKQELVYGTNPLFVAAQCVQISGPIE